MVAEIITTVERRRQWTTEEKLRIMSEALAPGVTIAAIADRNGVCRSLLYTWLRLAREDRLPGISITPPPTASFVPVRIEPPVVSQSTNRPFPSAPIAPEVRPASLVASAHERRRGHARQWPDDQGRGEHRARSACPPPHRDRRRPPVITIPVGVRIYLACGVTDMRRGFDGLSIMAQDVLKQDPFSGSVFCFRGRRGDLSLIHISEPTRPY